MSTKVSVIVPVYNVEKYLEKCLDSLINQTLEDIEIICVNDGSTDNSLAILQEYQTKDNRIKIITQENKGLSGARNTGMRHVTGKYVLFVDSDDWIEIDTLESLFSYSVKFKLDITMYPYKFFHEESLNYEENDSSNLNMFNSSFSNCSFGYKDILNFLFKIPHNTWNKFYSKSFLDEIDEEFIEGKNYEDIDFFFKTIFKTDNIGVYKEKPLYNYRIRKKSICTSGGKYSSDIFYILTDVKTRINEIGIYNQIKQDFFLYLIVNFKFVYKNLNKIYADDYFKLLKENYINFNLDQVDDSINKWHFDDRVFYQAITLSDNSKEFELTYKKLYYEFLANHYENLANTLQEECNRLNQQLNEDKSLKNQIKGIFK